MKYKLLFISSLFSIPVFASGVPGGGDSGVPSNSFNSSTPFLSLGGGATTSTSESVRWGHNQNIIDDFGAYCNGSNNDTNNFPTIGVLNIPPASLGTSLTNYCNTTIAQNAFPNLYSLFGLGRVMDSSGNLRGPIYSTVSTQPTQLGNYDTGQLQAFNADYTHVPFAIEANIIGTALGPITSSYILGRQTSSIFIRDYQSAGWQNGTDGTLSGRSGHGSILVDFQNDSPGGDASPYWFEGLATGVKSGATTFAVNSAITGPAGQLNAGHDAVYMEPFGDLDCVDAGFDAACMSVINLKRTNATGNKNTNDIGINIQSTGTVPIDAFYRGKGPTSIGIDLTGATFPDSSAASGPAIVGGGSNYNIGDLVSMAGGTCDQVPTFVVKTLSGSSIATLGIERKGMCSVFPSNPVTLTTVTGSGSGATGTVTNTSTVAPAIAMTANQMIYFNSFQDVNFWGSQFPSTTWVGTSYFGYKSNDFYLVNSGKIVFQGESGDLLIPSTSILKVQGGIYGTIREITTGSSNTATTSDTTIVWRSATASAKAQTISACSSTNNGQLMTIKDGQNNASTYNITITPSSGTIDGSSSVLISNNHGTMSFQCDGTATDWIITSKF